MNTLTNTYLDTINPHTPYTRLLSNDVLGSIIMHTLVYLIIIIIVIKVFKFKTSTNLYLSITIILLIIMIFGYIGRLARAKSLYINFIKSGQDSRQALTNTMDIMHNAYFVYYFIG